MSLPGFTAEHGLGGSSHSYYGAPILSAAQSDEVGPEFLGAIGELFEKISEAISGALRSAVNGPGDMIAKIRDSGSGGRQQSGLQPGRDADCLHRRQPSPIGYLRDGDGRDVRRGQATVP
jgi:hypothetical protein